MCDHSDAGIIRLSPHVLTILKSIACMSKWVVKSVIKVMIIRTAVQNVQLYPKSDGNLRGI